MLVLKEITSYDERYLLFIIKKILLFFDELYVYYKLICKADEGLLGDSITVEIFEL